MTKAAGFGQGFDTFLDYRGRAGRAPDIRAMTAEAIDRIDDLEDEGRPRDPFFLYLQPMNVHGPYRVPEDARSLLLGRPPSEAFTFFGELMRGLMNHRRLELRNDVGAEMLASLDEQYDTAVRHSAEELGHFFDALADRALFDDALVVLTADHGEELFDHGGFAHRYSLYEEVLHVPLFVKLPGQREARTVTEPVSLLDLRATIEEVVGIEPAPSLARARAEDGLSLAPLLTGPASEVPPQLRGRAFVAQAENPRRMVGRSLRVGDDVLIVTERSWDGLENAVRLYDLTADPRQLEDLSDSDPERVAWMRDRLEAVEAEQRAAPLEQQHYEISPGLAKALEVLGYL